MCDTDQRVILLLEMAGNIDGRIFAQRLSGSDEANKTHHQVELLVDAGLANWTSDEETEVRITQTGYDFINASTLKERFYARLTASST